MVRRWSTGPDEITPPEALLLAVAGLEPNSLGRNVFGRSEGGAIDAFSKEVMLDLLDARLAVEVEAAALAAVRASEERFDEVEALLANYWKEPEQAVEHVRVLFHRDIAAASNNVILQQAVGFLTGLFEGAQHEVLNQVGDLHHEYTDYCDLLGALRAEDGQLAARSMRRLLERTRACVAAWDPATHPVRPRRAE